MWKLVNYGDSDEESPDETREESTSDQEDDSNSSSIPTVKTDSVINPAPASREDPVSTIGDVAPISTTSMAISICAAPDVVPMVSNIHLLLFYILNCLRNLIFYCYRETRAIAWRSSIIIPKK